MVCLFIHFDGEANKNYLNGFIQSFRSVIYNGNKTEWSPIQSVIIRVIRVLKRRVCGARTAAGSESLLTCPHTTTVTLLCTVSLDYLA